MNSVYNDIYKKIYGDKLFESVIDSSAGNTEAILKQGTYPMYVDALGKVVDVDLKVIVNAVNSALGNLASEYDFMYRYIKWSRPMYVLGDPNDKRVIHKTMAVDNKGNLWMNIHFIYNNLDCDKDKIFGILFHELMHNFLNHIERAKDVKSVEDMESLYRISPKLASNEQLKQNICMDYEVNCNMVADGVVSKDFWKEFGGCFDEKYFGKMWEEIYIKDGDELTKKYLESGGTKLPKEYFEIVEAILEAMKVLRNPKSTDKDKDIAKHKLEDLILKLFGDTTKTKMTIRKRLQKLQATRIKEIGEIGLYLKSVIDDLEVSPRNMSEEDLSKFSKDVETLKGEMLKCVDEISDEFRCVPSVLEKDIKECMNTLLDGVTEINKDKDISTERVDEITDDVIYSIDKLLADNIKKKELAKKRTELMREKEEERKKKMEDMLKKARERHILKSYLRRIEDLQEIHNHTTETTSGLIIRLSDESYKYCGEIIRMVEPLLENITIEDIANAIKLTGLEKFKNTFDKLSSSLHKDLMRLKEDKVLFDRDKSYFDDICGRFNKDNYMLFQSFTEDNNETELISKVKIAISSIRRIGKELHRQQKVRPSEEYKKAYKDEYERLRKIYVELGEKGLRKELGLPEKEK